MPSSRVERLAPVLAFGYAPDWDVVIDRVNASARGMGGATGATTLETEREAMVIAFAFYVSADDPGRPTATTRTTVRQLATLAGLREDRVRHGIELLNAASIVTSPDGSVLGMPATSPAWDGQLVGRLAEAVLRPAPTARALRWDEVRTRAGGSTRALAATAAFLDLLPVPGEWASVSLNAVGAVARYSGRKTGEAVQRAVECGVLDERRERGSASLYRFAAAVLQGGGSSPQTAIALGARRAETRQGVAKRQRDEGAAITDGSSPIIDGRAGMRPVEGAATLMVGGVPFPVPSGVRPQLEQDADGRYWYRLGSVHFGPVDFR